MGSERSRPRSTADLAGYRPDDEQDTHENDDGRPGDEREGSSLGHNVFDRPDSEQTGPRRNAADAFDSPRRTTVSDAEDSGDGSDSFGGRGGGAMETRPDERFGSGSQGSLNDPDAHRMDTRPDERFESTGSSQPARFDGDRRRFESPGERGRATGSTAEVQSSLSDEDSRASNAGTRPLAPGDEPAASGRGEARGSVSRSFPDAGETRRGDASEPASEPLLAGGEGGVFRERWEECQRNFVDEPRESVKQADELVAELMQRLARQFAETRSDLEQQWDRGDEVSTEDLRVALQRYREFFNRLLAA